MGRTTSPPNIVLNYLVIWLKKKKKRGQSFSLTEGIIITKVKLFGKGNNKVLVVPFREWVKNI